jgi:regulatory protein
MVDHRQSGDRARRASVLVRAVALLSRREHSARELRRKLIERGFIAEEVDAALQRLQSAGLQDDTRFAEALSRSRANSGRGPLRLRAELALHGLADEVSTRAVEQAEDEQDWRSRALELAARRLRGAPLAELRDQRRLADFLLRRGFPSDVVRAVVRELAADDAIGDAAD